MFKTTRNKDGHSAFTLHEDTLVREIITDCKVSIPFDARVVNAATVPHIDAKALWDTGATNSVITQGLVDKLKLIPFRKIPVNHAKGLTYENAYKVNIVLPNNVGFSNINVTLCQAVAGKFDLIIGMDIITQGDFAITNKNGKTVVSYRIPSQTVIDFNDGETIISEPAKNEEKKDIVPENKFKGASLNKPCPCGSGKLYKRCHGLK